MTLTTPRSTLFVLLLALTAASSALAEEPLVADKPGSQLPAKPRVLVTISKETTYITEPLRPDGYPDYIAALNQQMSKGVTPENNAAVLFWQAMGPAQIDAKDRETYFQVLGIAPLPASGDYFVDLDKYVDELSGEAIPAGLESQDTRREEASKQQDEAGKRLWSKDEFPLLAGWLATNEKPLALLTEASKRPRRYDPLLPDKSGLLFSSALPAACQYRDVIRALSARAMLRASEGQIDQSWDDLLACHRLARLVGQGPTLVDALVAITDDLLTAQGDQGLLSCNYLKASQITKMRADLDELRPMPKMVDKLGVCERFMYLGAVSCVARNGITSIPSVINIPVTGVQKWLVDSIISVADWNVALRMGNSFFDHFVDAFSKPLRSDRKAALGKVDEDIGRAERELADWRSLVVSVLGKGRKAISERVGRFFVVLFLRAISNCADVEDRAATQFELTKLAFGLAAYRAENDSYPAKLADLTPKYVAKMPKDIFSDSDLRYKREGDGYLLYSVGVNGRDDGAKTYDDREKGADWDELVKKGEDWDDLVVRMPAAGTQKEN